MKHGAAARLGLEPDLAAVALHDPLGHREPETQALVLLAGVEPLEEPEETLAIARGDADSVVGHRDPPAPSRGPRPDGHRRLAFLAELDRVAHQVLEEATELKGIGPYPRHPSDLDLRSHFVEGGGQVLQDVAHHGARIDLLEGSALAVDLRVLEDS